MKTQSKPKTTFFYLEDLLYNIVFEAKTLVSGDGCSIFLWDNATGCYILRESTVMTRYIGKNSLDHTIDENSSNCGFTNLVAKTGKELLAKDIHKEPSWHWYKKKVPKNIHKNFYNNDNRNGK